MKTHLGLYILFTTLSWATSLDAQYSNNEWEELPQMLGEDPEQEVNSALLFDQLSDLITHPLDLNKVTKEELERLPFLSAKQIESILAYIYIHGPLKTPFELQLIEEMDFQTISLLLPFIQIIAPIKGSDNKFSIRGGKSTILLRADIPLSLREGYRPPTEKSLSDNNKRYLGSSNYHFIKYEYNKGTRFQCGATLEKDAGEQFLKGYDNYSFHILFQKLYLFNKIALGDYRISFGQGLVINQGFRLGKTFLLATTNQKSRGITRNFSTDENNYLRGGAASIKLKNIELSLWSSLKKIDTRIENDTIRSIITTGLHRTERELENKRNSYMYTFGGNVLYKLNTLSLGLTTLWYGWNKPYWSDERRYNLNYFRGNHNGQISIDYRWNHRLFSLFGETATSSVGGIATLNGITYYPFKEWKITLLQRYYSQNYDAYFSGSFSANSRVQNESGIYLGTEFKPLKSLKIAAYADLYSFPGAKYLVDAPSEGIDLFLQSDWYLRKRHIITFRIREKSGEKNASSLSDQTMVPTTLRQSQYKIQHKFIINSSWGINTAIAYNYYNHEHQASSCGWMFSESVNMKLSKNFHTTISAAIFDTDDYFSSIYNYEPSVLYGYASRTFYGEGARFAVNLKYENSAKLSFWIKYGLSYYFDRETIGSGLDKINKPYQHEINTLVRYKF